jgi:hypothetical protein
MYIYIAVNLGPILFVEGQLFVLTLSTKLEVVGGGWHIDQELDSLAPRTLLWTEKYCDNC